MDEKLIDQFIADKVSEITKDVDTDVDLAYEALEQFWKIMALGNNGTTSRMVDFFRFCAGVTPDAEQSVETNTTSDYSILYRHKHSKKTLQPSSWNQLCCHLQMI